MKTQRGNKGISYFFFDLGASWRWVVNATPWPHYPWGGLRPVWTGAENLARSDFRSADRPSG